MGANPLLGTWKLQSFVTEYEDDGERVESFGARPDGYLSYGADGRMYVIVVCGNRQPPVGIAPTDAEKVRLFGELGAYAGTYTIEGNMVRHRVDISWIETWTGSTQNREFRIEGDLLYIRSPAATDPLDGRIASATLVWKKVQ